MQKPMSEAQGSNTRIPSTIASYEFEIDLGPVYGQRTRKGGGLTLYLSDLCRACFEQLGRCACIIRVTDSPENMNIVPTYNRLRMHAMMIEKTPACISRKLT